MKRNLPQYSQIIESLHEGIWIIDKDANTIFVNAHMAEMLGYSVDEMLGKPLFSFLDEDSTAITTRALERRRRGIKEQFEHQFLRKDGTPFHALIAASPVYDDEGNYAGAIAGVLDITERKRLEESLQESEERYRDLSENANDLIQSVTPDGRLFYVNKKWREMLGYSEEEVADLSLWDIIHPDYIPYCKEVFQKVFSGETIQNIEAVFVAKDGKLVTVEGNVNCRYEGGKPVSTRGIFRDITERRQAEKALRQSEARFRLVAETASNGILSIDSQANITFWNHRAETLFGYSANEIIGKPLTTIIPPRFRTSFLEGMKRLNLRTDLSAIGTPWETLGLRKDGSEFQVEQSLAMWEQNGKTFFTSIVRDVAERRTSQ